MTPRSTAYLLVQIKPKDGTLEVGRVAIFSEERPTLCAGGGTYATLLKIDADTFEGARDRLIETVNAAWPWITIGEPGTPILRVGTRFFSMGLNAMCRVTGFSEGTAGTLIDSAGWRHGAGAVNVHFTSEGAADGDISTDVPMDLAAKHLASGRWRIVT